MDEEMLGEGTADVMACHGDRTGEFQRGSEPRDPCRESRDRGRLQCEFAS
jgi:hypothetical protein